MRFLYYAFSYGQELIHRSKIGPFTLATLKKTFKKQKKLCFKRFAKSINYRTSSKYMWSKCNTPKVNIVKQVETSLNKISTP